jgi:hypothetical protein
VAAWRPSFYNDGVARGWESNDIESQIEEARDNHRAAPPPNPEQQRAERERDRLPLERTRLLGDLQRACHPRHRGQLEAALRHIEAQLSEAQLSEAQLSEAQRNLPR